MATFIPKVSIEGFAMDEAPVDFQNIEALRAQGIDYAPSALADAMDSAPTVTDAGVNAPWFYLNYMAKRAIQVATQRTTIDDILGRTQEGSWAHVAVTKQFRELTGKTANYKDFADITAPRVNRGYTRMTRSVIRLSAGMIVSELENRQSALVPGMYSPHQDKREAIALITKLDRDAIGYFGYQLGDAECYGLLNDPNLDAFTEVAAGAGTVGKTWAAKTFHDITRDIMTAVAKVQSQAKANFIPASQGFKLVIPVSCDQYLGKVPECGGVTVREWFKKQYPKAEIVVSPVFDGAVGGENCFYVIVDKIGVSPCAEQVVPASLFMVGSMKRETGHSELWSMATCGTFVEQPIGIARYFGI